MPVGANDDEIGSSSLCLLFNCFVDALTRCLDSNRCRVKLNSGLTYNRRTVRDHLLARRLQRLLY